ncbi:MAG: VTT domain-containing protein [Sciscionella sp.]
MQAVQTTTLALGPHWLRADYLLHAVGPYMLPVVAAIIFAECGLLIGFFLPGDTLLFPLGLFIAHGDVRTPIWLAILIVAICAIAGNVLGYGIGRRIGPPLFDKPDSRLFRREYVDKTHAFFERHGGRAILLARLIPIVRTFITAVAGIANMDARKFLTYSAIGGLAWVALVSLLGYFLGQIPFIRDNVELIVVLIAVISVLPVIVEIARSRRPRRAAAGEDLAR